MTHKIQSIRVFTFVLLGTMLGLPRSGLAGEAGVELTPAWLLVDLPDGAVQSLVLRITGPDGERIAEARTRHNALEWPVPMNASDGLYSYEVFVQTRRSDSGSRPASRNQTIEKYDSETLRGLFRVEAGTARPEVNFNEDLQ